MEKVCQNKKCNVLFVLDMKEDRIYCNDCVDTKKPKNNSEKVCKKCNILYEPTLAYQVYCDECRCIHCNKLKSSCSIFKKYYVKCEKCNKQYNKNENRITDKNICNDCTKCKKCKSIYILYNYGHLYTSEKLGSEYCTKCICNCCYQEPIADNKNFCNTCINNKYICKCGKYITTCNNTKEEIHNKNSKYCRNHSCIVSECSKVGIYHLPKIGHFCDEHKYCSRDKDHKNKLVVEFYVDAFTGSLHVICSDHCIWCKQSAYYDFKLCEEHIEGWFKKVKMMLLCERSRNEESLFHKDYFPLDMFKVIFSLLHEFKIIVD